MEDKWLVGDHVHGWENDPSQGHQGSRAIHPEARLWKGKNDEDLQIIVNARHREIFQDIEFCVNDDCQTETGGNLINTVSPPTPDLGLTE